MAADASLVILKSNLTLELTISGVYALVAPPDKTSQDIRVVLPMMALTARTSA